MFVLVGWAREQSFVLIMCGVKKWVSVVEVTRMNVCVRVCVCVVCVCVINMSAGIGFC